MNCPVCNRHLAPSLSICLTCGAMMNDSVREELRTKAGRRIDRTEVDEAEFSAIRPLAAKLPETEAVMPAVAAVVAEPAVKRSSGTETTELDIKNTCQTLMDFQNKNAAMPDWRIQLQNSVRRRKSGLDDETAAEGETPEPFPKQVSTRGAKALKPKAAEKTSIKIEHKDPVVMNALKRIEASRRAYMPQPEPKPAPAPARAVPNRAYPFNVVSRTSDPAPAETTPAETNAETPPRSKPKLVSKLRIEKRGLDTNKLPPINEPEPIAAKFEAPVHKAEPAPANVPAPRERVIDPPVVPDFLVHDSERLDEATNRELDALHFGEEPAVVESQDDLAPVSMRFAAGLFDVIIGTFAAFVILSPLAFAAESWFTTGGVFAFVAAFAVMLFLYTTAAISRSGKTLGMHIFSLELIDADDNVYPTLHQAAARSAAFLFSLGTFGLGFVPMLFTADKQAAHDWISGTVVVREI